MRYVILLLAIAGCGNPTTKVEGAMGPIVEILIFTAPWCESCHHEVPLADEALRRHPEVKSTVYVVSGEFATVHPTTEVAAKYCQAKSLSGSCVPDLPWRWAAYKRYFPNVGLIPAAVALNAKGQVVRKFGPGHIGDDIRAALH